MNNRDLKKQQLLQKYKSQLEHQQQLIQKLIKKEEELRQNQEEMLPLLIRLYLYDQLIHDPSFVKEVLDYKDIDSPVYKLLYSIIDEFEELEEIYKDFNFNRIDINTMQLVKDRIKDMGIDIKLQL